jgi:hypothetical protein
MPRALTIFFPGARAVEYWYTALVFKVGDSLERNGESWIVTSITSPDGGGDADGKHMTITVRARVDGDELPRKTVTSPNPPIN